MSMHKEDYVAAGEKVKAWTSTHTTIVVGAVCLVLGRLGFPWIF